MGNRRSWTWVGMALWGMVTLGTAGQSRAEGAAPPARVERGRFLVTMGACNDCHTPMKMGQAGPEPDMTRMLSGHPEALAMPPAPVLPPGPWMAVVSATMTAWSGPWGTSFTANLTPDAETGLGRWTERNFVDTVRNGRHLGQGRPILPPMPIPVLQTLGDEDLGAIFAYLRTIPAVRNRVPSPLPPPAEKTAAR
jgi:mono/diheme cytochrome c family protein